ELFHRQPKASNRPGCDIYVSGAGADSTEQSPTMWKRVRGETENALLASPLRVNIFRPSFIMAEKGIRSKTPAYAAMYSIMRPLMRVLGGIFPIPMLSTEDIGKAMLNIARLGESALLLDNRAIVQKARNQAINAAF
ncbi:MAG: hypothetical protein Q4F13_14130, partial [Pseudomonadota bacterium]|nr:hypothetical protein [Pseudomonadota bacterium]